MDSFGTNYGLEGQFRTVGSLVCSFLRLDFIGGKSGEFDALLVCEIIILVLNAAIASVTN